MASNMNGLVTVKRDLTKDISDILVEFHSTVFKMVKIAKKLEPNNIDVEWLQNKLALARDVDPLLIINRCKDKIWAYRNEILEENTDFFMNNHFSQFIKNDENKTFMYTLLGLFKKRFLEFTKEEQKYIWSSAKSMLALVIKYKKAIGDYAA